MGRPESLLVYTPAQANSWAATPIREDDLRQSIKPMGTRKNIRDRHGRLYHLQSHQFRHSVGMRLINDDVPLEVIRRLFGHHTMRMTQVYARMRAAKVRESLERAALSRKTVNAAGQVVKGDAQANDPEVQLVRKGIRGQTLPIGGCR